ncbi:DUF4350 domain-containing protein [Pararcticibacter amylolyticus]|uniref:DUF4350 domain-containing protein n=1 Tax=Pararcticibacter amylolyticus TaxID=2173175 RepID=A0A2U2PA64_9SPHI|nr:DUF4350 domain-containing protein [Pararcticibacter amylolyticus]PWG78281.1 DUF4350 domain-containing protein [Pararcticibacter amylolyticus]
MKDLKWYTGIFLVLLTLYLVAQLNKPKQIDWKESFSREDKIPFGTYIAYNRLGDIFRGSRIIPKRNPPYFVFTENKVGKGSYIIISNKLSIDQYDFKELKKYMRQGNDVFMASYFHNRFLTDSLKITLGDEAGFKTAPAGLNFVNPSLRSDKYYRFDKGIGDQFFRSFDTARAVVLGVNSRGRANFIKYSFGKGALYLLAGPHFFTNYNMLKPGGAEYAARALSYLKPGGEIVWDEYSALGPVGEQSPMRAFLDDPQLKMAWYLALFTMLIFVIYEIKRRQRIIPVIAPLQNTTAEFVGQVGRVYYEQKDHAGIARKKVTYLLEYIRTRYHLKMEKPDKEFAQRLAVKSGLNDGLITELMAQIAQIDRYPNVTAKELTDLNQNIEAFYKNSR